MPVHFIQSCPSCGRRVRINATLVNQEVSCRHCGCDFLANSEHDPDQSCPTSDHRTSALAMHEVNDGRSSTLDQQHVDEDVETPATDELMLRVDQVLARAADVPQPAGLARSATPAIVPLPTAESK